MDVRISEPSAVDWSKIAEYEVNCFDLVARHLEWAKSLAFSAYRRFPITVLEADDFVSYAIVGLMESASRFDQSKQSNFRAFASKRIQGEIYNNVTKYSDQSQSNQFWKKRATSDEDSTEISDKHESREHKIVSNILDLAVGFILQEEVDEIDAESPFYLNETELTVLHQKLFELFTTLPSAERIVMEYHYRQLLNFSEIGNKLGLTPGRISQLHTNGIKRLREKINWR